MDHFVTGGRTLGRPAEAPNQIAQSAGIGQDVPFPFTINDNGNTGAHLLFPDQAGAPAHDEGDAQHFVLAEPGAQAGQAAIEVEIRVIAVKMFSGAEDFGGFNGGAGFDAVEAAGAQIIYQFRFGGWGTSRPWDCAVDRTVWRGI